MSKTIKEIEIEAAKNLEDAVNNMSWNGEDFVEQICFRTHRTLQANIFRTLMKIVEVMGSDRYGYDLRNEACHTISKQIVDAELHKEPVPYI